MLFQSSHHIKPNFQVYARIRDVNLIRLNFKNSTIFCKHLATNQKVYLIKPRFKARSDCKEKN